MQHLERVEVFISPFVERHDELLDLSGRRDIPADDAAGRKGRCQRLENPPRLGEIEDHPVEPLAGRSDVADVSCAKLEPRRQLAQVGLDVLGRLRLELRTKLVGDDAPLGTGGAAQRHRERPGSRPGLEHIGTRGDVGLDEDRADVLRIHDLRPARHLQNEVGHPWAERVERHAGRGPDHCPLVGSDEQIVRHAAAVGVPRLSAAEAHEVPPPALVDEQDAFAWFERRAHEIRLAHAEDATAQAMAAGFTPSSTESVTRSPVDRTTSNSTVSPGSCDRIASPRAAASGIASPSNETTTSPSSTPASSAGPPGTTLTMPAPSSTGVPYWNRKFGSDASVEPIPMNATGSPGSSAACVIVGVTELIWMANPMFSAALVPAVLMPTTLPAMSTSGPPELPGLMAASVWITSVYTRSCSEPHSSGGQPGSPTVIRRVRDDTMPEVTDGPPSNPSAYPRATTCCPSRSSPESPSGTAGSPSASMSRTARSAWTSPPITLASNSWGCSSAVKTVSRDA